MSFIRLKKFPSIPAFVICFSCENQESCGLLFFFFFHSINVVDWFSYVKPTLHSGINLT